MLFVELNTGKHHKDGHLFELHTCDCRDVTKYSMRGTVEGDSPEQALSIVMELHKKMGYLETAESYKIMPCVKRGSRHPQSSKPRRRAAKVIE